MASSSSSIEIVEDLWTEIFKRLPIKSIGQLRSVCKAWNSLLSSTLFFAIHHNFTAAADEKSKSYLLKNERCDMLLQGTLYHPPEEEEEEEQQQQQQCGERVRYLDLPYSYNPLSNYFECLCFRVIDVVHGVVCLSSGPDLVIWNPAIRKHISGRSSSCDGYKCQGYTGFGFDAANNYFKVVKLSSEWRYDVLSVRDCFWRRFALPDAIYSLNYYTRKSNSCFANGNIYWIAHNKEYDASALLLFDCEGEEFNTVELPQELTAQKDYELVSYWLFKHGDNLAVVTSWRWDCTADSRPPSFEVWVMEEKHSWKKLSKHSGHLIWSMGKGDKLFKPCYRNELVFR